MTLKESLIEKNIPDAKRVSPVNPRGPIQADSCAIGVSSQIYPSKPQGNPEKIYDLKNSPKVNEKAIFNDEECLLMDNTKKVESAQIEEQIITRLKYPKGANQK